MTTYSTNPYGLVSFHIQVNMNPNEIVCSLGVRRDDILYDQNERLNLSRVFSIMGIPPESVLLLMDMIVECARTNLHRPDIRFFDLEMTVRMGQLAHDDAAFLESSEPEPLRFTPASESSIEELEKVRVEGVSKQCTVCLEEILVGAEATRMPCSHEYHESCINKWLMTSNLCPLCRFPMPSS